MLLKNNIYRNLWTVFLTALLGVFSACNTVLDDPLPASGNHFLTLSRVVINATDNIEYVDIETARVLIFDANGNCVTNQLFGIQGEYDNNNKAYILNFGNAKIDARYGTNHVYVVLNEETGGLTTSLETEGLTKAQMDGIRSGKIPYTELIPVEKDENGKDKELPFVMCVYDQVNVTERVQALNLTGFGDRGTPVYGYGMRRTMAKMVLESIIGGVSPDGTIVGTNEKWNGDLETDQTVNDIVIIDQNGNMSGGNTALASTSEVFVTKVELLNVPNVYSWAQDKNDSQDQTVYGGGYLTAQDISAGFTPNTNYLSRSWPGNIKANGTIDFSRTDHFPVFWKQEANQGTNSYDLQEAYAFASEPDPKSKDAEFNSGNFIPWVTALYAGDRIIEGEIVPEFESMELESSLNPAVWTLDGNETAYYIPENIVSDEAKSTMLRVYFSIGVVTAEIDPDIIKAIIDKSLADEKVPIIKEDGTIIEITGKDVSYVISQAKAIKNSSPRDGYIGGIAYDGNEITAEKDWEWGICYDGINAIWHGKDVAITDQDGYYFINTADPTRTLYIDVPLNNDTNQGIDNTTGADDHNIYRGHEYRVKLYVTKSDPAWSKSASPASRTINIGGEELTITGKVVAKPMN